MTDGSCRARLVNTARAGAVVAAAVAGVVAALVHPAASAATAMSILFMMGMTGIVRRGA